VRLVTADHVAEVVSMMTGIPVKRVALNEMERLKTMYENLKGKVVGQDEAIKKWFAPFNGIVLD
jgi:ATP-dependent Clp protease ATP-binding subunit ClpC